MRIQPLYDLQQEVNRLFIAGSKFAKNDPRLLKLVPVFEKLGERAPVFKKIANDIEDLTKVDAIESSEKLSAISTLLYSVLYTQGDMTEPDAEKKEQSPHFKIDDITTLYSYLELKPAIKALSESNQGRMEIVEDARKRGIFKDFRTYAYLDMALGDKYAELTELADDIIREDAGKTIIPILIENFSYEGRKEDVRRLLLLHHFGYEGIPAMVEKIMQESAANLQAGAIKLLSEDLKNEDWIIELTGDKNKAVREAAYMGLAKLNTEKSQNVLKDLYIKNRNKNKTNFELLVYALQASNMNFFFNEVFQQVQDSFKELLAIEKDADNKNYVAAIENFQSNISVLSYKDRPEVYSFLEEILLSNDYNKLIKYKKNLLSGYANNVSHTIISVLRTLDAGKTLDFYKKIIKKMQDVEWKTPFYKRFLYDSVSADKNTYETFIDAYNKNYIDINDLIKAYAENNSYYAYVSQIKDIHAIERKWIDRLYEQVDKAKAIKYNEMKMLDIIDAYEPASCNKLNKLLKSICNKVEPYSSVDIFQKIMDREVPDRFDAIYSVVKNYVKGSSTYYFSRLAEADFWEKFPKEYIQKFKDLFDKTKLNLFESIAYKIQLGNE